MAMDNHGPPLSTRVDPRAGDRAAANNSGLAWVLFHGLWFSRIEPRLAALQYFALNGTEHPQLRKVIHRAESIKRAKVS